MSDVFDAIRDAYRWVTKKVDPVDEPEMNELQKWLADQAEQSRRAAARRQNFMEREMAPKPRREENRANPE